MNPEDIAPIVAFVTFVATGGLVLILRGPLGKAIAHRLEGGARGAAELDGRLGELESRVADLEHEKLELTERVEFAERLLSQGREAPRELG